MLFRIVHRLKVPSQQPWVFDIRPGCDGALAGVLLAMLPCLSKLRVETARSMPLLFKMLFKLDGGFPLARVAGFAKMNVCHISHCRANFPWFGLYKEVPLLGLPCLTLLHLTSLHQPAALQRTRFINCVGISHVTDLRIGGQRPKYGAILRSFQAAPVFRTWPRCTNFKSWISLTSLHSCTGHTPRLSALKLPC
jgi:hypothetical protein